MSIAITSILRYIAAEQTPILHSQPQLVQWLTRINRYRCLG